MDEIDTLNKYGVGMSGARINMLMPPRGTMSPDDALNLAAWLVAMAEGMTNTEFTDVLEAVRNT